MSGFLTPNVPSAALFTGQEKFYADTQAAGGAIPQSEAFALYKLALVMTTMLNSLDKTMVAGSIYYVGIGIGYIYTPTPRGSAISENSFSVTGINVPVGTPGGTDTWHVYVFNSGGTLVARSATAGVTAGTALTIQQIPLYLPDGSTAGPVTLPSAQYYIGLQSNGTTAKFKSINSPIWSTNTSSQTGTAGTAPTFTAPTTYTANLGPLASFY